MRMCRYTLPHNTSAGLRVRFTMHYRMVVHRLDLHPVMRMRTVKHAGLTISAYRAGTLPYMGLSALVKLLFGELEALIGGDTLPKLLMNSFARAAGDLEKG